MSICLDLKDDITLLSTKVDGYGSDVLDSQTNLKASIALNTGFLHNTNQEAITSDAIAVVSGEEQYIKDNFYRLEEMFLIFDIFNTPTDRAWYKIIDVDIARDILLCNKIDHVQLNLKKTAPVELPDVS